MKKEYDADILKAFSQSYFAEFLEEILSDSIMQDYQGQLREKLDPSYIKKTLNEDELTEIDRSYYFKQYVT